MGMMQAKVTQKTLLAPDVYEIHYDLWDEVKMLSGQFITFLLPKIGWRAYSILELQWRVAKLIIKRWSLENWGRWGSIMLCDAQLWDEFKCVWPAWHFSLTQEDVSRCFLWTGTGFVPLYNQIQASLDRWDSSQLKLVFWVRKHEDLFYISELDKLTEKYKNFSYSLYLSREETENTTKWYITDYLSWEIINSYKEFYICGAPWMIESCQNILAHSKVKEENIFFEKYT